MTAPPNDDEPDSRDGPDLRPQPFYFDWPISSRVFRHCCTYLEGALLFNCDQHGSPFECPDNAFIYNEVFDEYGVIKRNPDGCYTRLCFCPFCGTKLPASREDDWKRELAATGYDLFGDAMAEVHDQTGSYTEAWRAIGVPELYLSAAWRLTNPPRASHQPQ